MNRKGYPSDEIRHLELGIDGDSQRWLFVSSEGNISTYGCNIDSMTDDLSLMNHTQCVLGS